MSENTALTMTILGLADPKRTEQMAQAILRFLPGAAKVPAEVRLQVAHLAVAHGLDPFLGEVWAIPQRSKQPDGTFRDTGAYTMMVGIAGRTRKAHATGRYLGHRFDWCDERTEKAMGVQPGDVARKCLLEWKIDEAVDGGRRYTTYEGYGLFKSYEKSKMNPLQACNKRALADALRQASPITGAGGTFDDEGTGEALGVENGNTRPAVVTAEWHAVEEPTGQPVDPERAARDAADLYGEDVPKPSPQSTVIEPLTPQEIARGRGTAEAASRGSRQMHLVELYKTFYPDKAQFAQRTRLQREYSVDFLSKLTEEQLDTEIALMQIRVNNFGTWQAEEQAVRVKDKTTAPAATLFDQATSGAAREE